MSVVIGKVSNLLNGKFYVKNTDGSIRELSIGDSIYEGDLVVGEICMNVADRKIYTRK